MNRYILGISGASGPVIGLRLLEELLKKDFEVHLIISRAALGIIEEETPLEIAGKTPAVLEESLRSLYGSRHLYLYPNNYMEAPVASGSFRAEAMFVVPCSMKTLSGIANGYAQSLIERAADVCIKEKRRLVLSPREMPLSAIHLENMLKLARLGVGIAPPIAGFYPKPESVNEMVDFFTGKILDLAGIENGLFSRWKEGAL